MGPLHAFLHLDALPVLLAACSADVAGTATLSALTLTAFAGAHTGKKIC